ncbi:MAG: SDR family oxidoreductase [Dehalococcoidia bacterium]|nr:SDR family oxidoreductase [Dehalococcoidia bacterium]
MSTNDTGLQDKWALILGASSGFGGATAIELARHGMHIFGVHLDMRSTLPNAEKIVKTIEGMGRRAVFFNTNAASPEKRKVVVGKMQAALAEAGTPDGVRVVLHSLAFGTLRPYIGASAEESITQAQVEMTADVMANSLVYWVQDMVFSGMLGRGGRIYAMTSAGSERVITDYGAISAAKCALESHIRQLACELMKRGITANAIRAGVTDTPALRKIPSHAQLIEYGSKRNPGGRMTTPEDVAKALALLAQPGSQWISGNIINVDGGEQIVGG